MIKYLHKKGITLNKIHENMISILGDASPSYFTIEKWAAEFKRGRESLEESKGPDSQDLQQQKIKWMKVT